MAIDYAAKIEALEEALSNGELTVESDGDRVTYRSIGELQRALTYFQGKVKQSGASAPRPATTVAEFDPR